MLSTPYYYDEKIIAYSRKCTMLSSLALPNLYYLISEEQAKSQKEMEVSRLMYKVDCHILLTSGENCVKCYLLVRVSPPLRHMYLEFLNLNKVMKLPASCIVKYQNITQFHSYTAPGICKEYIIKYISNNQMQSTGYVKILIIFYIIPTTSLFSP